ncbi:MAG: uncharacterized protein A8A55_2182 [Amphiamblys sp. WSBS2006]|nr:MAG: uncharacterized protein A8A55_2182 [Amphiamblys sp. WSBS2006]
MDKELRCIRLFLNQICFCGNSTAGFYVLTDAQWRKMDLVETARLLHGERVSVTEPDTAFNTALSADKSKERTCPFKPPSRTLVESQKQTLLVQLQKLGLLVILWNEYETSFFQGKTNTPTESSFENILYCENTHSTRSSLIKIDLDLAAPHPLEKLLLFCSQMNMTVLLESKTQGKRKEPSELLKLPENVSLAVHGDGIEQLRHLTNTRTKELRIKKEGALPLPEDIVFCCSEIDTLALEQDAVFLLPALLRKTVSVSRLSLSLQHSEQKLPEATILIDEIKDLVLRDYAALVLSTQSKNTLAFDSLEIHCTHWKHIPPLSSVGKLSATQKLVLIDYAVLLFGAIKTNTAVSTLLLSCPYPAQIPRNRKTLSVGVTASLSLHGAAAALLGCVKSTTNILEELSLSCGVFEIAKNISFRHWPAVTKKITLGDYGVLLLDRIKTCEDTVCDLSVRCVRRNTIADLHIPPIRFGQIDLANEGVSLLRCFPENTETKTLRVHCEEEHLENTKTLTVVPTDELCLSGGASSLLGALDRTHSLKTLSVASSTGHSLDASLLSPVTSLSLRNVALLQSPTTETLHLEALSLEMHAGEPAAHHTPRMSVGKEISLAERGMSVLEKIHNNELVVESLRLECRDRNSFPKHLPFFNATKNVFLTGYAARTLDFLLEDTLHVHSVGIDCTEKDQLPGRREFTLSPTLSLKLTGYALRLLPAAATETVPEISLDCTSTDQLPEESLLRAPAVRKLVLKNRAVSLLHQIEPCVFSLDVLVLISWDGDLAPLSSKTSITVKRELYLRHYAARLLPSIKADRGLESLYINCRTPEELPLGPIPSLSANKTLRLLGYGALLLNSFKSREIVVDVFEASCKHNSVVSRLSRFSLVVRKSLLLGKHAVKLLSFLKNKTTELDSLCVLAPKLEHLPAVSHLQLCVSQELSLTGYALYLLLQFCENNIVAEKMVLSADTKDQVPDLAGVRITLGVPPVLNKQACLVLKSVKHLRVCSQEYMHFE